MRILVLILLSIGCAKPTEIIQPKETQHTQPAKKYAVTCMAFATGGKLVSQSLFINNKPVQFKTIWGDSLVKGDRIRLSATPQSFLDITTDSMIYPLTTLRIKITIRYEGLNAIDSVIAETTDRKPIILNHIIGG